MLERYPVARREIDTLVWGSVIIPSHAPNVGREIVLDTKLGPAVEAMTVSRACTSGLQAITLAAASIERGEADAVIAGGSDSTSNTEVKLPQKLVQAAAPLMFGKRNPGALLGAISQLGPLSELLPRAPKVAERTTGQTMGEAAETMARRHGISRQAQDELALRSHQRASRASESGCFAPELVAVDDGQGKRVEVDTLVRGDTSLEKLAKLKPAFAQDGSLTAGNSSPLTDGGAAVLLMSEGKARSLGFEPLARLRSWAYVGVDPADQLLIGPALAMRRFALLGICAAGGLAGAAVLENASA